MRALARCPSDRVSAGTPWTTHAVVPSRSTSAADTAQSNRHYRGAGDRVREQQAVRGSTLGSRSRRSSAEDDPGSRPAPHRDRVKPADAVSLPSWLDGLAIREAEPDEIDAWSRMHPDLTIGLDSTLYILRSGTYTGWVVGGSLNTREDNEGLLRAESVGLAPRRIGAFWISRDGSVSHRSVVPAPMLRQAVAQRAEPALFEG